MKTAHDKVNENAVTAAARKRLFGLVWGNVRVRELLADDEGVEVERVKRELLETGHYRRDGADTIALTDEGLRGLAGTMAEEPEWQTMNGRSDLRLCYVRDAATWAWLYLHADECEWFCCTGFRRVPFVPGTRPITWDKSGLWDVWACRAK